MFSRIAKVQAIAANRQAALLALDSAISLGYNNVGEMDTLADFNSLQANETYFKHLREQVYFNRNPCMADAHAREFDFWVGEWDVYQTGTRNYAGHSLVQLISRGCALLENWDSPASSGKSINFVDPVSISGSNHGPVLMSTAGRSSLMENMKDSAMRFVFEMTGPQGNKIIGRFIFYNLWPLTR